MEIEQYPNQENGDGHDDFQALDGILKVAKFSDPFKPITRRQLDFISNLSLCIQDGAAEVAAAYTEFDRNVALLLFPVDERGARNHVDPGDFLERDLRHGICCRILKPDRQPVDGLKISPERFR